MSRCADMHVQKGIGILTNGNGQLIEESLYPYKDEKRDIRSNIALS